jgi:hypothetical protein
MAPKKKAKPDPIKSAVSGILARLPFIPKRPAASAEPFSAIEDDTPLGDLLSSSNAAPGMAIGDAEREKPDFHALLDAAAKNTPALVGITIVILLLLAIAVTAIIVAAPPKPLPAAAPFTEKGEALVKAWLPPPGDPLEPRIAMEREGVAAYTPADAARLGINPDPAILAALREKNDADIRDLYGTAP